MTTTLLDGSAVLARAADLMARNGKCARQFYDNRGRMCTEGALSLATWRDPMLAQVMPEGEPEQLLFVEALHLLETYLDNAGDSAWIAVQRQVTSWSDASSEEHVLATLRAAAGVTAVAA